ncbi:hypothetical protein CASFOL_032548 [Castilleja foliolosa]|uniref:Uncharacterized protein n=1 Tax=Castilleja foliolosa TaxID=1961234 RepID=A0ABD3C4I5_9LAMI
MMTIPLIYQAKATCIKLILIALAIFLLAIIIMLLAHDNSIEVFNAQPPKNKELKLKNEFQDYRFTVMPGGAGRPVAGAIGSMEMIRWPANESLFNDFAL